MSIGYGLSFAKLNSCCQSALYSSLVALYTATNLHVKLLALLQIWSFILKSPFELANTSKVFLQAQIIRTPDLPCGGREIQVMSRTPDRRF
jgi:hypothetical protein